MEKVKTNGVDKVENEFRWSESPPEISGRVDDFNHHFDFVDKAKTLIESILGKEVEVSFPKTEMLNTYEGEIGEEDLMLSLIHI